MSPDKRKRRQAPRNITVGTNGDAGGLRFGGREPKSHGHVTMKKKIKWGVA